MDRPDHQFSMSEDKLVCKPTNGYTGAAQLLLIESEPLLRRFLKTSLQEAGFVVYQTGDKQEAIELLQRCPIDLILLDSELDRIAAPAICAELRRWRDVPIIMVAAPRLPEDVLAAFLSGVDDYIAKPFQLREVEARIQRLLRRDLLVDHCSRLT